MTFAHLASDKAEYQNLNNVPRGLTEIKNLRLQKIQNCIEKHSHLNHPIDEESLQCHISSCVSIERIARPRGGGRLDAHGSTKGEHAMVNKPMIDEDVIEITIRQIYSSDFTVIDFINEFKKVSPKDWSALRDKYGELGDERNSQYTVKHYLSQRLMKYSSKEYALLQSFTPYTISTTKDYRETTDIEKQTHGSRVIAVYRKK